MKTCTKCKIEKPFEAFYKNKNKKDGCYSECKECGKARREELKKSPLMQLEKQVRFSVIIENKLLSKEGKRLCGKCKDIFLIEDMNGRHCRNCNIEYKKEYWLKSKDKASEQQKKYREKNKDKHKEYRKEYSEKNKDKIREYFKEYHIKKKLEKLQNNDT